MDEFPCSVMAHSRGAGWEKGICPSKLVRYVALIGPQARSSHTFLKRHTQICHLGD